MNAYALYGYLVGVVVIGLPLAQLSVWFYTQEEELDYRKNSRLLKMVRDFIHPGSFVNLPDYEHHPRRNYHFNYEGPIDEMLDYYADEDERKGKVLNYLILSSLMWPGRLLWSLVSLAIDIVLILIGAPFVFLAWFLQKGYGEQELTMPACSDEHSQAQFSILNKMPSVWESL